MNEYLKDRGLIQARDIKVGMRLNVGTAAKPVLGIVTKAGPNNGNPKAKTMQIGWKQDGYGWDLGGQFLKSYEFRPWNADELVAELEQPSAAYVAAVHEINQLWLAGEMTDAERVLALAGQRELEGLEESAQDINATVAAAEEHLASENPVERSAHRMDKTLAYFQGQGGGDPADDQTTLIDLLTDLMHWASVTPSPQAIDFEQAVLMARSHYADEQNGAI
jgi:hypothetical protein